MGCPSSGSKASNGNTADGGGKTAADGGTTPQAGAGGGGSGGSADAATAPDAGSADAGVQTTDAGATSDGGKALPTITGFTALAGSAGGGILRCDSVGNCYAVNFYHLPPNGTMFSAFAPGVAMSSSNPGLLVDGPGNVYVNGCTKGVYKQPPGGAFAEVGTGLTGANGTSCLVNTLGMDSAGTLYVGFPATAELWKLPTGGSAWENTGAGLPAAVYSVASVGKTVYAGTLNGVFVLTDGAASWVNAATGTNSTLAGFRLYADHAGNLLAESPQGGSTGIYRLAAGTMTWTATTGYEPSAIGNQKVTEIVVDAQDNAYVVTVAQGAAATPLALLKLAAGTTTWTKVVDLPALANGSNDTCSGLADDHIGHLIVDCTNNAFRSQPQRFRSASDRGRGASRSRCAGSGPCPRRCRRP